MQGCDFVSKYAALSRPHDSGDHGPEGDEEKSPPFSTMTADTMDLREMLSICHVVGHVKEALLHYFSLSRKAFLGATAHTTV